MRLTIDKSFGLLKYLGAHHKMFEGRTLLYRMEYINSILLDWGANTVMQQFGIFCCIYGKQYSCPQLIALDRRPFVENFIGNEVESLVYMYSALSYDYFSVMLARNRTAYTIRNRWTNENVVINRNIFSQLILIEAAFQFENILYQYEKNLLCNDSTSTVFKFFSLAKDYLSHPILKKILVVSLDIHKAMQLADINHA